LEGGLFVLLQKLCQKTRKIEAGKGGPVARGLFPLLVAGFLGFEGKSKEKTGERVAFYFGGWGDKNVTKMVTHSEGDCLLIILNANKEHLRGPGGKGREPPPDPRTSVAPEGRGPRVENQRDRNRL